MTDQIEVARRWWLDRYLNYGEHRLRRVVRLMLQDLAVETTRRIPAGLRSRLERALPVKHRQQFHRMVRGHELRNAREYQRGPRFHSPRDLAVTPTKLSRVLILGSCMAEPWTYFFEHADDGSCPCDFILVNNLTELPEQPPRAIDEYDFQVVQLAVRKVVPDLLWAPLSFGDLNSYQKSFNEAEARLSRLLDAFMHWNRRDGLMTFVTNFPVPQQNPMGRLMPRYDLRNPVFFLEQLNASLACMLAQYQNAYLVDLDQLAASMGRRYVQDDSVTNLTHVSLIGDADYGLDQDRIEPALLLTQHYTAHREEFMRSVWTEIVAMYRTLRQIDAVKLVAVDLDDTLWRGLAGEGELPGGTEGWPIGLAEALSFLKQRGMMLAIVSRNEESRVTEIWSRVMPRGLRLEDFAFRKIDWRPKAEMLGEIIRAANILPRSVVFIDDNPVERASVAAALPGVRVLGSFHYYLRRILLWSAETQVPVVTEESSRRTTVMQAQARRESSRQRLSRTEFLATLDVRANLIEITSIGHSKFARAFELLNKTNQFNTTGERWRHEEAAAAFGRGAVFYAVEVEDRYSAHGLVGVVIAERGSIEQFVMSCRVLGLDVEYAVLAEICRLMRAAGAATITARLVHTDTNFPCRELFARSGFSNDGNGLWLARGPAMAPPAHIRL